MYLHRLNNLSLISGGLEIFSFKPISLLPPNHFSSTVLAPIETVPTRPNYLMSMSRMRRRMKSGKRRTRLTSISGTRRRLIPSTKTRSKHAEEATHRADDKADLADKPHRPETVSRLQQITGQRSSAVL